MMEDEKGVDEKIIAVPHPKLTAYYNNVTTYKDLPDILVQRIVHFFEHYKDLEPNKWVKVQGCYGLERAEEIIRACIEKAGNAKG